MKQQKIGILVATAFITTSMLLGCASPNNPSNMQGFTGVQVRTLASSHDLMKRLTAVGVQTVVQGDHVRLILHTDDFFDVEKSELSESKEPTLNLIAQLVGLYGNVPIYVQGYTDSIGYDADNTRRSTQQANDVAAVLWSYGIDQRRMYIQGYGSQFPIADNRSLHGREANRRIEIVF